MGIAERVPHMQKELDRPRAKMAELTRGISTMKEGLVYMSDLLELRRLVGPYEVEIAGLRQAILNTPFTTLSREPAESSRLPEPIYYGDRSIAYFFFSFFERGLWRMTQKTL